MAKDRNALKSGIFILVTVAAIIAVIVGIKGLTGLGEPMDRRAVAFSLKDDLGGLQVGDDIRVGGYKVGVIESINVVGADAKATPTAEAEPVHIRVEYTFPRKFALHRDAIIRIQTGVTGPSCLNFESLGTGEALPSEVVLAGKPSRLGETLALLTDLSAPVQDILRTVDRKTLPIVNETVAKLGKTADSITTTGDHATKLVDDARGEVKPAVEKYHVLADRAAEALVKIRDLLGDTTPDFRTTMANLKGITESVNHKAPSILDRVDGLLTKLDTTLDSANAALEDVKTTAANARDLTGAAKEVIGGNRGKLDTMIASLKTASDNLKNATAEIRRSPWRLLYKPAPNEMANLNLYDAAREFAEGANDLNDASLALRDALHNKQSDKETVEKLMQRVNKSFDNFNDVEQRLWTKVKE
jgi:phospholipid/cholesterol/gamma-HCH transport system substrate-binding protein